MCIRDSYYSTETGLLWGIQTLRQTLEQANFFTSGNSKYLPMVDIKDAPKYDWRGFHIDVVRHMFTAVSYTHLDVYKRQDLEENQEAKVVLTAINVEGSEVTQTFDFHIVRPQIPEVLYLHYNGEVVEMTRSAENPYLYLTEVSGSEEGYPMELTGKISTTESLDDAELIWGAAEKSNTDVYKRQG